jgi:hypothetical protein
MVRDLISKHMVCTQDACEPQNALKRERGGVKVKQGIFSIGDSWCPNLVHHFFRRIPEERWRKTVRARSDISTLAMAFSLVFALSRQKTSIKSHEVERLTSRASLPAPSSLWPLLPHGPFTVKIREFGDPTQRTLNFLAFEMFVARPQWCLRLRER